jgi:hypothetical protein
MGSHMLPLHARLRRRQISNLPQHDRGRTYSLLTLKPGAFCPGSLYLSRQRKTINANT